MIRQYLLEDDVEDKQKEGVEGQIQIQAEESMNGPVDDGSSVRIIYDSESMVSYCCGINGMLLIPANHAKNQSSTVRKLFCSIDLKDWCSIFSPTKMAPCINTKVGTVASYTVYLKHWDVLGDTPKHLLGVNRNHCCVRGHTILDIPSYSCLGDGVWASVVHGLSLHSCIMLILVGEYPPMSNIHKFSLILHIKFNNDTIQWNTNPFLSQRILKSLIKGGN